MTFKDLVSVIPFSYNLNVFDSFIDGCGDNKYILICEVSPSTQLFSLEKHFHREIKCLVPGTCFLNVYLK